MCFCPYSYHYQHCQSVSLLGPVPSYSQRICYRASSQETYSRQRPTLQLPANLDLLSPVVFTTLTSLPTASITQLKQPYLYIHDHLINAIGSQKLSYLCLLDLSAAFDTIDHNILITSWFGIHGSVINWFKSYLTSSSFRVKCDKDFSSEHISSCGVPQGSILGPLLFVMYTIPLSILISSLFLSHHLYADDTQLFSRSILATLTPDCS